VGASVDDELTRELRSKGYRLTPQRQLVLQAVSTLDHATPDSICERVRDLSTIYRNLELLEELGLVTHTHLGHGSPVYHAANQARHLHLVCRVCGSVAEASVEMADDLAARLRDTNGFETDLSHLAIFGRCAECQAAGDTAPRTAPKETRHD
jgi:Fur family transcriptional regulator, ferric uptake regulator